MLAPFNLQADFDNSGLLIGASDQPVKSILLALDITSEVVEEAVNLGVQLIISHHPVIFKPLKHIETNSPVDMLIKSGIGALCAHTNLDFAEHNTSVCLCNKLGIKIREKFELCGVIGEFDIEITTKKFIEIIKNMLNCQSFRYTDSGNLIKNVAIVAGAGGDYINYILKKDVQAFITGEIKHNKILEANSAGIMIFELGHYVSENVIMSYLYEILKNKFSNLDIIMSSVVSDKIFYA
ncbi:MAG: Nif3-like dinuclear metal center hexameric protein [Candidatus Improbicoccus devescovinae]|nr:MAG: Nif3-like dinuclear metal center hexameric protein [Candidatus Improbicoccus devescovinae]